MDTTTCPDCKGKGGWEHDPTSGDPFEGAAWEKCLGCDGEGVVPLCARCDEPVDRRSAVTAGGGIYCAECAEILAPVWAEEDYADAVAGEEY